MEQTSNTRQLLLQHYQAYPLLQIQDICKFLFQGAFGCEHMVTSPNGAVVWIDREYRNCNLQAGAPLVEPLDGNYSRVHLAYLARGLHAETLGKLFVASARTEPEGQTALENKLAVAQALVQEGALPFSPDAFADAVQDWKAQGYPAIHHSNTFREHYHPAYRVIANQYVPFLPLFAKLDALLEKGPTVLAIEGGSASGKTTLSALLQQLYDCTVFHMDDFFLRPEQRTAARLAEPGGNIDRERFLVEVLTPMAHNAPVNYRRFDCATMTLTPPVQVIPKKLTVIEGVYSMHPAFRQHYDLSVFLNISPELQRSRIAERNSPQFAQRFFNEWIPLEEHYFSATDAKAYCHLCIPIC